MKLSIPAGTTSKRIAIFIQDSSSTTGAGLAGLAFNSAGLTCYSWIDTDGNATGTSQALQTATKGTWTTRGFVEKDATNMPGFYEFGIPDALLAAGVKWAVLMFKGATNMAPLPLEIEVTAVSNQDAVRGGMTALPNANAGANGGLPIGDASGRVDVGKLLGTAWLTPGTAGTPDVNVKLWNALTTVALPLVPTTAGRTLDVSAGGEAGVDWANVGSPTTANGLTGTTIATSQVVASVTGAVGSVTGAVGSVTGNVGGNVVGSVASVTGNVGGNVTGSVGSVVGAVGSVTGAVGSVTGNVGGNVVGSVASVTGAVGSVTGNVGGNLVGTLSTTERNAISDALLDRDMSTGTDSGSPTVRTVRQALRFMRNKWSISAGTLVVTKENDTTTSWTATVTQTAGNPVSTIDPA